MFAFRAHLDPDPATTGRVEVAFTDASLDLQSGPDEPRFAADLAALEAEAGVPFARLAQVHGRDVVEVVDVPPRGPVASAPSADALVTTRAGIGLMIRVADCVPVVLADPGAGVLGVAHAGRRGVETGVVPATVDRMRTAGAGEIRAWIGPHVCGRCYEVPTQMQEEVVAIVPETRATTRHGTPALDLGAGVRAQLDGLGIDAVTVAGCTLEDERLHSYRRDGAAAGRFAGLVWRR